MSRKTLQIIKRLVVSTALVSAFMVLTQDIQIFPGVISGLIQDTHRDKSELPADVKSYFISTEDGEQLEAWHLAATNPESTNSPIGLFFHGNAENVESTYQLQRWFKAMGLSSVSFDFRGYNKSSGWPSDAGLQLDVKAVLKFLQEELNLKDRPLILLGVSIGSGLAAYASQLTDARALVLISPYTNLRTLIGELPLFGMLHPLVWYSLETKDSIRALKDTCLILAHGTADTTIPVHHSDELFKNASHIKDKAFIRVDGAGHNDLFAKAYKQISQEITTCLTRNDTSTSEK